MKKAAKELNFEKAARLRDGIAALNVMQNQNIVEDFDMNDRDYIAHYREGELVSFTVLKMRSGKLLGRDNYRTVSLNEDTDLIPEFLQAYYTSKEEIPPQIFVPTKDGLDLITRWMSEELQANTKISLVCSTMENAARHTAAMNMAFENAHEDIICRLRDRGDIPALQELQQVLGLEKLPLRIEGFDIAHIGGKFPVASLISFYNGNPDKKNYKYFRLRTTNGIIDDFQSMREAAARRYTRLVNENAELPDLILIDGGIGQVNAVKGVLQSLNLSIPIAGLAKRDEEIYRPNDSVPVSLPKRSDALRLLQRIRDETHRFATSRNQNLRTKENTVSIFCELPHVGEKRAKQLMQTFTTLENFCNATQESISAVLKTTEQQTNEIMEKAKALLNLRNEKKEKTNEILKFAATTRQKAEKNSYVSDLAKSALIAAESEPEYNEPAQ